MTPFHELEGTCCEIDAGAEFCKYFPALGSDDGSRRPMVSHGCHKDIEFRPFGLMPFFEPCHNPRGTAGRCRHEEVLVRNARRHTIIENHAVFIEHQAITALTWSKL